LVNVEKLQWDWFVVFKDDEAKADAEKKLKPKRPRKVIKKSYMEDSYPTYLQVCILLFALSCQRWVS